MQNPRNYRRIPADVIVYILKIEMHFTRRKAVELHLGVLATDDHKETNQCDDSEGNYRNAKRYEDNYDVGTFLTFIPFSSL